MLTNQFNDPEFSGYTWSSYMISLGLSFDLVEKYSHFIARTWVSQFNITTKNAAQKFSSAAIRNKNQLQQSGLFNNNVGVYEKHYLWVMFKQGLNYCIGKYKSDAFLYPETDEEKQAHSLGNAIGKEMFKCLGLKRGSNGV